MTGISAAVIALESTEEVRGNSCGGLSLEGIAAPFVSKEGREANFRPFVPKERELSWFEFPGF